MIANGLRSLGSYLFGLPEKVGDGWNRFWFTPSNPLPASVLRILVGIACLYCIGSYTWDLNRWLGPDGLMPPAAVAGAIYENTQSENTFHYSIFNYTRDIAQVWIVHVLSLLAALAFTVGAWTTISGWATFAALIMYFQRNPLVTSEFEPVLVFLTLYLAITPAGAYFSVDRWLANKNAARDAEQSSWRTTLGMRLLQIHLSGLYIAMALAQLSAGTNDLHTWWVGEAAWSLAARGDTPLVDFTWMRSYLYLINAWTHAIVLGEVAIGLLLWNTTLRPLILLVSIVHWTMLALLTGLVPYAVLMMIAGLGFVTADDWRCLISGGAEESPAVAA